MKNWSGALFPLVLLLALAALTLWLKHAIELPDNGADGKLRHDPDVIVDQLVARKLDPEGRPQYRLEAPRMMHYPDKDVTEIAGPHLAYLRAETPTARVSAARAEVSGNGERIVFRDQVLIERLPSAGEPPVYARMRDLTVETEREKASTSSPVEIVRGKSRISGVGMDFDNLAQTFVLRSQVSGRIESRRHP